MKATWICTRYEPNKVITYTVFIPNTVIIIIDHTFETLHDGKTKHIVDFSGFGLNWMGKIMIKKMFSTKNNDNEWRENMKKELNYYLKYNKKIPDEV